MATQAYMRPRRRLFLKENREAKGVSAAEMARLLGIERESIYRLEKEAMTRMSASKQIAYAEALGLQPEALWRPPHIHSIDDMLASAPGHTWATAVNIIRQLLPHKD